MFTSVEVTEPETDKHHNVTAYVDAKVKDKVVLRIEVADTRNYHDDEEEEYEDPHPQLYYLSFRTIITKVDVETIYFIFNVLERLGVCRWSEFKCFSLPAMHLNNNGAKTFCPGSRYYKTDDNEVSLNNRDYVMTSPFLTYDVLSVRNYTWDKSIEEVTEMVKNAVTEEASVKYTDIPNLYYYLYTMECDGERYRVDSETNFHSKDKEKFNVLDSMIHKKKLTFRNYETDKDIEDYCRLIKHENVDVKALDKAAYLALYEEAYKYDCDAAMVAVD